LRGKRLAGAAVAQTGADGARGVLLAVFGGGSGGLPRRQAPPARGPVAPVRPALPQQGSRRQVSGDARQVRRASWRGPVRRGGGAG